MKTETIKPTIPERAPNKKYNVPMALWLVENTHRIINGLL